MEEIEEVIKCMTPCEICEHRYECEKEERMNNNENNDKPTNAWKK
jgi:hypothetical protein